ncbi:short subunit dehydrogenase [Streptomyces sp. BK340]|nr:short subunit dehydrogenase [Streptomyces sp. BK340]
MTGRRHRQGLRILAACELLSGTGATVVLSTRDPAEAEVATASIRSRVPGARIRTVRLDLADLSSLRAALESLDVDCLDAVVHNAGDALDHPPRKETGASHALMFGTNRLGHFTLTRGLMLLMTAAWSARVNEPRGPSRRCSGLPHPVTAAGPRTDLACAAARGVGRPPPAGKACRRVARGVCGARP